MLGPEQKLIDDIEPGAIGGLRLADVDPWVCTLLEFAA